MDVQGRGKVSSSVGVSHQNPPVGWGSPARPAPSVACRLELRLLRGPKPGLAGRLPPSVGAATWVWASAPTEIQGD